MALEVMEDGFIVRILAPPGARLAVGAPIAVLFGVQFRVEPLSMCLGDCCGKGLEGAISSVCVSWTHEPR